jgi:hypothetical protein
MPDNGSRLYIQEHWCAVCEPAAPLRDHIAALERGELPPAHVHYKHVNVALQVRAKANDGMIRIVKILMI